MRMKPIRDRLKRPSSFPPSPHPSSWDEFINYLFVIKPAVMLD